MLSSMPRFAEGLPAAAAAAAPPPPSGCLRLLLLASRPVCSASLQPGPPGPDSGAALVAPRSQSTHTHPGAPPANTWEHQETHIGSAAMTAQLHPAASAHLTDARACAASSFTLAAASSAVSFLLPPLPAPASSKSSKVPAAVPH